MKSWQIWSVITALALMLMTLTAAAAVAITPIAPTATCAGREATIVGSTGSDTLNGTAGADVIAGRGGADRIAAGSGADLICAGSGADFARGGEGDDEILGQQGKDRLLGNRGDDRLVGGTGSDHCLGGTGSNALVGCELPAKPGPAPTPGPAASPAPSGSPARPGIPIDPNPPIPPTQITSTPALTPAFDPEVSDYTVRCDGTPLALAVAAAPGDTVAVDGGVEQSGSFETEVPLEAEQEFGFSVDGAGAPRDFHVRCLPSNFPAWEYESLRQPSHEFYVVSPSLFTGSGPFAVIFDANGVPVWWHADSPAPPSDAKVLANGNVVWWGSPPGGDAYEIRDLEGNLLPPVRFSTGRIDSHEFQVTPDGNYLITSYQPRKHVDLSAYGGGVDATVVDAAIEEVTPTGTVLWEWSTAGHIGLEETGRWWPTALAGAEGADIVHMNAVEPVGNDAVLISLRHTDAVYKIDKTSGKILWKLGGTWTPKSLAVKGDPEGAYPLGGQHDVRLQPDGTITIHDNRTNLPGSPRGVRYEIDEGAKTATLVEAVTDPLAPSSFCCGSSRRSADGSWLFSWGGRSLVTEFDAAGQRNFKLGFGGTAFSYRAVPVPAGAFGIEDLRAGMDSMHPRL
jgi:Ca2+-binding RTX toxin-like protein